MPSSLKDFFARYRIWGGHSLGTLIMLFHCFLTIVLSDEKSLVIWIVFLFQVFWISTLSTFWAESFLWWGCLVTWRIISIIFPTRWLSSHLNFQPTRWLSQTKIFPDIAKCVLGGKAISVENHCHALYVMWKKIPFFLPLSLPFFLPYLPPSLLPSFFPSSVHPPIHPSNHLLIIYLPRKREF